MDAVRTDFCTNSIALTSAVSRSRTRLSQPSLATMMARARTPKPDAIASLLLMRSLRLNMGRPTAARKCGGYLADLILIDT